MPDLPKKKVGIVACSGEEIPEGTVTRLAALKVLESLRPETTVTICLPLFLAGGEGDRAFARFFPTITVDGCDLRCAAKATEMYSSKPAATILVRDVIAANGLAQPEGCRRLNEAGLQAVEATSEVLSEMVDELLGRGWDRKAGNFIEPETIPTAQSTASKNETIATCSCGSGIPIQKLLIDGNEVTLVALPLIFQQFKEGGKEPSLDCGQQLLDAVKIYNSLPAGTEDRFREILLREYTEFLVNESAS